MCMSPKKRYTPLCQCPILPVPRVCRNPVIGQMASTCVGTLPSLKRLMDAIETPKVGSSGQGRGSEPNTRSLGVVHRGGEGCERRRVRVGMDLLDPGPTPVVQLPRPLEDLLHERSAGLRPRGVGEVLDDVRPRPDLWRPGHLRRVPPRTPPFFPPTTDPTGGPPCVCTRTGVSDGKGRDPVTPVVSSYCPSCGREPKVPLTGRNLGRDLAPMPPSTCIVPSHPTLTATEVSRRGSTLGEGEGLCTRPPDGGGPRGVRGVTGTDPHRSRGLGTSTTPFSEVFRPRFRSQAPTCLDPR